MLGERGQSENVHFPTTQQNKTKASKHFGIIEGYFSRMNINEGRH